MLGGLNEAVRKCFLNNTKQGYQKSVFIQVISASINTGYWPYWLIFVICIMQNFIISASPPNDPKVVIGRKLEVN